MEESAYSCHNPANTGKSVIQKDRLFYGNKDFFRHADTPLFWKTLQHMLKIHTLCEKYIIYKISRQEHEKATERKNA